MGYVFADLDRPDKQGWIGSVYVIAGHRGKGIGRRLLESALEYIDSQGVEEIGLAVTATNEPAKHLYESLGFETRRLRMFRVKKP